MLPGLEKQADILDATYEVLYPDNTDPPISSNKILFSSHDFVVAV